VWAVAPCLVAAADPSLHELKPGRSIEKEPAVLVEQVKSLATSTLKSTLEHFRAVFGALTPSRMLSEVVVPAASSLPSDKLGPFLLTFLEFTGSWKEAEIKDMGGKLSGVKWVLVEGGTRLAITEVFDPEDSPDSFKIVRERRANIEALVKDAGVRKEAVWRVLRLCGIKREMTWEDTVEEAESVMNEKDIPRAEKLYGHIDKHHAKFSGKRDSALEKLQKLAWVPAKAKSKEGDGEDFSIELAAISDLFPAKQRRLVWAVAASLSVEIEPTLHELKPGRSIEKETSILVDQVRQLAEKPAKIASLDHLRICFGALATARILKEVVLPAAASLIGSKLTTLLLSFLEWAGSWKEVEIKELGSQLASLEWLPVKEGKPKAIRACFDPETSPEQFSIVKAYRAQVNDMLANSDLRSDAIWRVLRLCGLKAELTWEDAVEEAEAVVKDKDFPRAGVLMGYLDKNHSKLSGARAAALEKLQTLAWVPATKPSKNPEKGAAQFLALKSVFLPSEHKFVWAVAPALAMESVPTLQELKPGKKVESEIGILVEQATALTVGTAGQGFAENVEHLRAVFGAIQPGKVLSEVVLKVAHDLPESQKASFMLAFLEWAASLKEAEIRELGNQLSETKWLPTEDGTVHEIKACFDPQDSPELFAIVRKHRAKIGKLLTDAKLNAEPVWRVLGICGMKRDISWEDAVEEAEAVVSDKDFQRAGKLFAHLDKNHARLAGKRDVALEKLKTVAWVPATAPTTEPSAEATASGFSALKELFPPSARKLVWAVAPSLCVDVTPTLHELMPGRDVQKEPDILVEQVRALADMAAQGGKTPPSISLETLEHLRDVFQALVPLVPKLSGGTLVDHPRLTGVAFMPCLPPDEESGAALFLPKCTACSATHNHRSLSPAIGVVKPMDHIIKLLAEACGVPKEPSALVLAEALCNIPAGNVDLAVTLAIELAGRIRAKEEKPACIMVPTTTDTVENVTTVYIDDAPWQQSNIMRLHTRISADDGKMLGCTSVRAELIRQCEEGQDDGGGLHGPSSDINGGASGELSRKGSISADVDGDAFGQEADLVSQVMQLLQEYGDSADLVKEFVQNADDAGAESLAFFIQDESHGTERVVDSRTASLQGPALYVCCDNPLTSEDIVRMQNVGRSKKRLDFSSSGRFGVGMNVMYRYCDCPQLLANSRLHYFDLTRSYVSQPGMSRGRKFTTDKLKANFPDSFAPFENSMAGKFPTVFRLALRTERSDLGLKQDFEKVAEELANSAKIAEKMLLFTKKLTRLEFYKGEELIAAVQATTQKEDEYKAWFDSIPKSPLDLTLGKILSHRATKMITITKPGEETTAEWAIAHRIGITEEKMLEVLKEQLERPFGVALYPHGACAVKIKPFEEEHRSGRICVGLPTPFKTNSSAWIHGGFALLSSRKSLPLPEEVEREPSLDKSWNKMLLTGVISGAMHELITHCCSQVIFSGMQLEEFFSVFPLRGDRLQTLLAASTFKASLTSAVFPVFRGSTGKVSWAAGPKPTFACEDLSDDLQKALVEDGLKLASLPDELMLEYEEALGEKRSRLGGIELCQFLHEAWEKLHGGADEAAKVTGDGAQAAIKSKGETKVLEFELGTTGMLSLSDRDDIVSMMAFAAKDFWKEHMNKNKKGGWHLHKFNLLEHLDQVPLLLTHNNQISAFSTSNVKFNSWRDILPTKAELFIHKDCHKAIVNAIDTTAEGINREVKSDIPGIRPFTLTDLLPYREELEASINPNVNFASAGNEVLRQFWSLVADSALTEGATADLAEKHGVKLETTTEIKEPWHKMVQEWPILPVCYCDGEGENGEGCVSLHAAGSVVAVSLVVQDPGVAASLAGILKQCGVATLQGEMLADERIARIVQPLLVTTNRGMLKLLCDERSDVEALSGAQRHELLAYFSVLSVKGGIELEEVARLPLFKTADPKQSKFVPLKPDLTHCCVDPADKHSNALCKLTPPRMVLLAWPTAQGKPIYEYCGVKLCTGEDFMISHVVPELPGICAKDDGSEAAPYLKELHAYVCIDGSDRVKKAAAECDFVPSEDMTMTALASTYVSTAVGAAKVFASVLKSYLPAIWIQQNAHHMELLMKLGMSSTLTPSMILLCAKHLHKAFTGDETQGKSATKDTEAETKGEKRKVEANEVEEASTMEVDEEDAEPATIVMAGCKGQPNMNGTYTKTEKFKEYLGHDKPTYLREHEGQNYFVYFWKDDDEPESTGWYIASEVGSEDIFATNKKHDDATIPPAAGDWEVLSDSSTERKSEPSCGFPKPASNKKRKVGEVDVSSVKEVKAGSCKIRPALNGAYERTEEHKDYLDHDRPTFFKKGCYVYFWNDKDDADSVGWYIATEVGSEDVLAMNMKHNDAMMPPGPGDWEVRPGGTDEERKLDTTFGFTSELLAGVGGTNGKAKGAKDAPPPNTVLATPAQAKARAVSGKSDGEKKAATGIVTDTIRVMSYELVEEFARAAEEAWPKPGSVRSALHDSSQKEKLHDMWSLLETANLNILVARRHDSDATRKKELEARNSKRPDDKAKKEKEEETMLQEASRLELVPIKGVAFKFSRQVIWSVAPVAEHVSTSSSKGTTYLHSLVSNHAEGMYNVFGSYVKAKHAPPELVMKHLCCLCSLPESEPGLVAIKPGSILHEDLKACWAYFSDSLYSLESAEVKVHLEQLQKLACVAVHSEDVADRPVEEMLLTLPKYAFFQLPLLRGKEANLRLYLRQVQTEGPREAAVFRAFGAMERPGAADYASASERVAKRASKLGRAGWEWVVSCLEACVRGFHEDVLHKKMEGTEVKVENLHMFSKEGKPENLKALVWADVPRWLNRCTDTGGVLKIANLKGDDQRDIAKTLVDCAGMRELSALVEERRIQDDAGKLGGALTLEADVAEEDEASRNFKLKVQQLLQSFEFANGLCAVIRHTQTQNQQTANTPAEVRRELRKIDFKIALRLLKSALFWKPKEILLHEHAVVRAESGGGWVCEGCKKDGSTDKELIRYKCKDGCKFNLCVDCYSETQKSIPGSEQEQQIYFDEGERCVYIRGKEGKNSTKDIEDLSSEMVFALRRALPLLYQVDSFLLEALLGCGLRDGAGGIQGFLEKRDIKVVGLATQEDHLGPGQRLPEDLEGKLTWNMEASFGEGETAGVLINDAFTIVEVASWPLGKDPPKGSGLNRSYRVRVSGAMDESAYKTIKHFEIYKIPLDESADAAPECMEIEVAGEAKEVIEEKADNEEDDKKIADFKKYLHEMSNMEPDEYKAVMRRLFKTWHPDRAGDTPLSNRIFRMLRSHEQWYKKKQAEPETCGTWNDDEGETGEVVVPKDGVMLALDAPERHYVPEEGGQSSWFDEFESEMRNKKDTRPQSKVMARPPEKPSYGPSAEPEDFDLEKEEGNEDGPVAVAPPERRDIELEEQTLTGPGRIVDRAQAPIWLQQGRLELIAAKKLAEAFEGYRSLPASCVWHCEQVVEMAIKAAMLRTCGVSEDESIGGSAHDIAEFVRRLKSADAQTAEQRIAQQVPLEEDDVWWLKKSYLATRYPRPGDYRVPSESYTKADAERALKLAEATLKWASDVEDLPDPGILKRTQQDEAQVTIDIRKRRWADMVGTSGTATDAEKMKLKSSVPEWKPKAQTAAGTPAASFATSSSAPPGKAGSKVVMPPPKGGFAPLNGKAPAAGSMSPPSGKYGGAPEAWDGAPAGPPKAFGSGLASPPAAAAAAEEPAAGVNRWNRHKAATPAAPDGDAASGEKRGGYEDRVADLKERLKQRKLGKAPGA